MRILCILLFAACTTASTHIRRIYMRYALSGNFPILKISSATIYVNTKNNLCMKGCKFLQTRTRTTTIWAAKKSSKKCPHARYGICNCYAHAGYDAYAAYAAYAAQRIPCATHLHIAYAAYVHICILHTKHRFSSYNVYAYDAPHPHISCDKKPKGPRTETPNKLLFD